jgi:hypothetical protein
MSSQKLMFTLLLIVISILGIVSMPQNTDINFEAYNLHQNLSPKDINDLNSDEKQKAMQDVKTTIEEVQKLLALDENLPRLTK